MSISELRGRASYWVAPDLLGAEFLRGDLTTHVFQRHFHETYIIGLQESGAETFFHRGANHFSPTGSLVFINPGEVHDGQAIGNETWRYRGLYPNAQSLREAMRQISTQTSLPYFPQPVVYDEELAVDLLRLHSLLENSKETLYRQSSFLLFLSKAIARHAVNNSSLKEIGAEPQAVKLIRDYLTAHYRENPSLDSLAQLVNLNPSYLIRAFRREVGMPPHEFLIQLRITQAKKLLAEGMPIAYVAANTGFVDQSHFTHRFKRIIGVTPGQFALGSISYKTKAH